MSVLCREQGKHVCVSDMYCGYGSAFGGDEGGQYSEEMK